MSNINTVLFDLDGTLIDTAPDMAAALDILCDEEQQARLEYTSVRPRVSDGSVALVKLAFGDDIETARLEYLKQRYLDIYQNNLAIHSKLFAQIDELFDAFSERNIKWGVVTNKPGWLTLPLLASLGLDKKAACIVSGDTTENRKPHPEPMYHACEIAGSKPEHCMYVGDALRDIEAGNHAGMKTVVARYGYIDNEIDTQDWNADYFIDSPIEIIEHLRKL
jgi:phosphoglycolate phosphatase